ncbi:nucleotidyltransferase [Actinoplanes sp. TBRC 11911]|uniref:nucleotidyltransferase domain-containing protein n=1 Tax=Actinoplanes sp. TBRC 11911 TaxID=2729386 RepID=UPI00145FB739|nr:nucleotidyltransferase domain-containing protein [Actinoplanes sp. TBRC 11911]NMO57651.1 nucleotidyltransferase [Actinoplanes sp. TBRC 11911]
MDARLDREPLVSRFADSVREVARVSGFYAGGSIGSGDYHPGISDLDLVAVLSEPLTRTRRTALKAVHAAFDVPKLHCAYVPVAEADDPDRTHVTWAHEQMFRRPLSRISRAELHRFGVTVYGPAPASVFPPVSDAELAEGARAELRGYWTGALRHPRRWRTDLHVDLGLTTVSRADATIAEGRLITKREAIDRLPSLGVPVELAGEIRRRRAGETVTLTEDQVRDRAVLVRAIMRRELDRLLRVAKSGAPQGLSRWESPP